ncbi:WG repeat-containing protein [uncultured Psychroserpens sp.]|uniref:WG repeat-containing protein n=1 Tax=uncultured Psychroserpens sp. TaxID=255436 RepID=UPI0026025CAD|nr:WG repeat-containing protein [uncultured Psychroserpens sp.]
MKTFTLFFLIVIVMPFSGFTQAIDNLSYISPFHDGFAAIEKDGKWAFINEKGTIVVDFRTDLVTTTNTKGNYPIFTEKRCLIKTVKDGISYFGYIDTSGKTIVEPQYLNATNFHNGLAIVLELITETVGRNEALGKNVVYYKYYEVAIDVDGAVKTYLTKKPVNVVLDKKFLKKPPQITTKQIADELYAIKKKNKWTIITSN